MSERSIRIGGASAFYGDSQLAARQLIESGDLDYLVFDYLAEATMAILSRARHRDDNLGYAVDFITVTMRDILRECIDRNIRIIANAGGVNVPACVAALRCLAAEQGVNVRVAGVLGDDLTPSLDALQSRGLADMTTGVALPGNVASINAYLGARPIADALDAGADIVITGRIVDSALALGPCMHAFGWSGDDYDRLAQGSLAGHIIECGAQCSGGNFTDWEQVPDFATIGYPIAEIQRSGSFEIGIPATSGGLVTTATVGEQILYEIGDPANYRLPDVACDFTAVKVIEVAHNRVVVEGARGHPPGNEYKVCAVCPDGFRLLGAIFMAGDDVASKARCGLDAWLRRTSSEFERRGWDAYRASHIEIVGAEDTYGPHGRNRGVREVMAKYGVHHDSLDALRFAAAELAYLATSGPPGMSGFGASRPRPQPAMRVHSSLLEKSAVPITIELDGQVIAADCYETPVEFTPASGAQFVSPPTPQFSDQTVPLRELAYGRSGDKGNDANIGILARSRDDIPLLAAQLTAEAVRDHFAHAVRGNVERYDLPGLGGFNFVLHDALGGGATASLRLDSQGKAFAQMLLDMPVRLP